MPTRVNINSLKEFVEFLLRKRQSGDHTPEEFNTAIQGASRNLFAKKYGFIQQHKNRNGVSWEEIQKVRDDMIFLLREVPLTINSSGLADLPDDYNHWTSLDYRYYINKDCTSTTDPNLVPTICDIDVLPSHAFRRRQCSKLLPVTKSKPIAKIAKDQKIQFYHTDLGRSILEYLTMPVDPVWGYTGTIANPIYDAATSIDPDWPEQCLNELAAATMEYMGIAIREAEMVQWAMAKQEGGI